MTLKKNFQKKKLEDDFDKIGEDEEYIVNLDLSQEQVDSDTTETNFSEIHEDPVEIIVQNSNQNDSDNGNLSEIDEDNSKSTEDVYENNIFSKTKSFEQNHNPNIELSSNQDDFSKSHKKKQDLLENSDSVVINLPAKVKSKTTNTTDKEPIPVFTISSEAGISESDTGKLKSKKLSAAIDETLNVKRFKIFHGKRITYHKKCSICGKMQQNLKQHMYTHTKEKNHTCSYCGKGFSQIGNFKNHLNTHTGNKPYTCTLCIKSFAEPNSLKMHMVSHSGDKKYHCDICGKNFGYSHTLSAHKATHSLEKNYKCPKCNKAFGSA